MGIDSLSEAEAANELMRLARQIAHHNRLYHAEDSPKISDAAYDALVARVKELGYDVGKLRKVPQGGAR